MKLFFANKRKKYIKKIFASFLIVVMTINLCGCGLVPSLDLTDEEQKVIAEYAAGLLLKHDKNYHGSLQKVEEEPQEEGMPVVAEEESFLPQAAEETEYADPEFSEDLAAEESAEASGDAQYSDMTIAEAIGIDGFDILYKSYETHEIYPEEESDDLVFSLQAQNGMELLVLNFGITNNTDSRMKCDVIDTDSMFRLLINGSERANSYKTILLNDLSSYSDEIEGYGMADAVLVFEVAQGTSANIQSIDLIIKNEMGTSTHALH